MKIGIDARFFGLGNKGLGRYTEELIKNLEKIDKRNKYIIFLKKDNFSLYRPENPNFIKTLADFKWYGIKEQIKMPGLIKKEKIDLMHFPHFNASLFCPCPFVITIHDLILLQFPTPRATTLSPWLYKIKRVGYKIVIKRALLKAKHILTVSEYTKKQIIRYFKIKPEKITVAYEAVNNKKEVKKEDLKKYNINKPYLLYVGNAYPHKNLEGLLKAFKKLIEQYHLDYQLVLTGKTDYFYERLKEKTRRLGLNSSVVFFGFAKENILASLYKQAELYVFPSFLEGFGLPPLEAMNYGLPVASSKTSCLPEILGPAALYFNPYNEEEIIKTILEALNDKDLRKTLVIKGFEQIKKYSWENCAQKTLKIYEENKRK